MGGNSSKNNDKLKGLSKEEYEHLNILYSNIEHKKTTGLTKLWENEDLKIMKTLLNYYERTCVDNISFNDFAKPYVCLMHGTSDEKAELFWELLATNDKDNITRDVVVEYVADLLISYVECLKSLGNKNWKSWDLKKCPESEERLKICARYLCHELDNGDVTARSKFDEWLKTWTILLPLHNLVFIKLFNVTEESNMQDLYLFPYCLGLPGHAGFPSILDQHTILILNYYLPFELRSEWRFLFSTDIHGESFSKLVGQVINQGSTILVVKDTDGYVFGGFATENWSLTPKFTGTSTSFLFRLAPDFEIYRASGYNEHFQYLNVQQQTLPNGLGMGGQFDYFGLFLDAEYGKGHSSESCTTYKGFQTLSGKKNFEIVHVEVWAVGPPPKTDDSEQRSILDTNPDARALLDLVGKEQHSVGYREVPVDLDD